MVTGPVSYIVRFEDGREVNRQVDQIRRRVATTDTRYTDIMDADTRQSELITQTFESPSPKLKSSTTPEETNPPPQRNEPATSPASCSPQSTPAGDNTPPPAVKVEYPVPLRRSARTVKPPDRLNLYMGYQVSDLYYE